jgi:hypothetical protein
MFLTSHIQNVPDPFPLISEKKYVSIITTESVGGIRDHSQNMAHIICTRDCYNESAIDRCPYKIIYFNFINRIYQYFFFFLLFVGYFTTLSVAILYSTE